MINQILERKRREWTASRWTETSEQKMWNTNS